MSLIERQMMFRKVGRIRLGERDDRGVPHSTDAFVFTSPAEGPVHAAASLWGGDVEPWTFDGIKQWRVATTTNELPIVLLPFASVTALTQQYEGYGAKKGARAESGVLLHLCDGTTDAVTDGPCSCDPDQRACKWTTRFSCIVPDLPGLGLWDVVTHSWWAGQELPTSLRLLELLAGNADQLLPATLRIEHRIRKRLEDGRPVTKSFTVPVLDLRSDQAAGSVALAAGAGPSAPPGTPQRRPAPAALTEPSFTPVPDAAESQPISVADQLAEVDHLKSTRQAPAIPSSGVPARKGLRASDCSLCGEPFGEVPLRPNPDYRDDKTLSRFVHATCLDQRDGGGTSSAAAEPAPVTRPRNPMTHGQHKRLFAVAAEAFPAPSGASGQEVDAMRKERILAIAGVLGQPGLTSRSELTSDTAGLVIDALERIATGELAWDGNQLVVPEQVVREFFPETSAP